MTKEDRDIQRKLKVLRHAEKTGHVANTCRYFGLGRSSFYRWKAAYDQCGEAGLVNAKPIPKNPANQTPPEIVDMACCRFDGHRDKVFYRTGGTAWNEGSLSSRQ